MPEHAPLIMDGIQLADQVEGWYAWRCANWGTKWEPLYSHVGDSTDECYLEIDFDTAWSPPTPFFQALADKFPAAEITLLFYEGGCDFSGACTWKNGVFLDESPEDGQTHAQFLGARNWFVTSDDDDDDDDYYDDEPDEEEYEADDGTSGADEYGLTFEELAGDDIEEGEEGEKGRGEQDREQVKISSLQQWAND